MKKLRVPLPVRRSTEMLDLAKKVLDKHVADGDNSVLNKLDWQSIKTSIEKAQQLNQEAETLRMQSAQRKIDRDSLLDDITTTVRSSRDILAGIHIKNMKNLGDWGFDVVEATAAKTKVATTTKLASAVSTTETK